MAHLRTALISAVAFFLLTIGFETSAQDDYPNRPIKLVVGFGAGGASDLTARILAEELRARLGQSVLIENRPSAGGVVAANAVAQAPSDGYTLLLIAGRDAISTSLFKSLPFDIVADFEPISTLSFFTFAFVMKSDSKIRSIQDLLSSAKGGGRQLNIGTTAIGGGQHLAAELFKSLSGLNALTVPFKNTPSALTALRGGDIDLVVENLPPVYGPIKAGDLTALAVTSEQRFPGLPQIPTVRESGVPTYVADTWNAIAAPAKTPSIVVNKLNREIAIALSNPEVRQKILNLGAEPRTSTPGELKAYLQAEITKWRAVIEKAGIPKQ